jgi:hypothetical protein
MVERRRLTLLASEVETFSVIFAVRFCLSLNSLSKKLLCSRDGKVLPKFT